MQVITEETPDPISASMFNPYFLILVLQSFCRGFDKGNSDGPSLPLLFLATAVVLHGPSRKALNSHRSGYGLYRLCQNHPEMTLGSESRVAALESATKQALILGGQLGVLAFGNELTVTARPLPSEVKADLQSYVGAADKLGFQCARHAEPEVLRLFKLRVIPCAQS